MFSLKLCAISAMLFAIAIKPSFAVEPTASPMAAPPRKCEIRRQAWCIYQGVWEISRRIDEKRDGTIIWTLSDSSQPQSQLVIFEPYGCTEKLADTVAAKSFEENIEWHGKRWDQMRVRLRSDNSCDLTLLVPRYNGDPMEWAFSVGRVLLAACKDEQCSPIVPTLGDVTEKYRLQFKHENPVK